MERLFLRPAQAHHLAHALIEAAGGLRPHDRIVVGQGESPEVLVQVAVARPRNSDVLDLQPPLDAIA